MDKACRRAERSVADKPAMQGLAGGRTARRAWVWAEARRQGMAKLFFGAGANRAGTVGTVTGSSGEDLLGDGGTCQ